MSIFLFYGLAICDNWVRVLYADQPDLHLTVIPTDIGKNVRLMSRNLITSKMESEWYVNGQPTRLKTFLGYLCGKLHDSGVVTCVDQTEKSSFTFNGTNTGVEIVADNNLCLTKMGPAPGGGFFLTLYPCKGGANQRFIIKPVDRDGSYLTNSYGNSLYNDYYNLGHYDNQISSKLSHSSDNLNFKSFENNLNNIDISLFPSSFTSYRRLSRRYTI